jgi:hypothetical protein
LFSKRYIQNIELGDTSIVIKGILYWKFSCPIVFSMLQF